MDSVDWSWVLVTILAALPLGWSWNRGRTWWIAEAVLASGTIILFVLSVWLEWAVLASLTMLYLGPLTFTLAWLRLPALRRRPAWILLLVAPAIYALGFVAFGILGVNIWLGFGNRL